MLDWQSRAVYALENLPKIVELDNDNIDGKHLDYVAVCHKPHPDVSHPT